MNNQIHASAILEGNISLGSGNVIGPNVVLRGNITIGSRNRIGAGTLLEHDVIIGDDNQLHGYVAIGGIGEMGLKGDRFVPEGKVVIGSNITIREFVCIHAPVHSHETRIHDGAYLMNKSYVAHDCIIGRQVVLSAGVMLGGRVVIEEGANIGMGATIHQRCHIGRYAMVGMLTPVTKDILPYSTVAGNPCRIIGFNSVGAARAGHSADLIETTEPLFLAAMFNEAPHNSITEEVKDFLEQFPNALILTKSPS